MSEGEVYTRERNLLANREAVVPKSVGGPVHEEQASMSELQLHWFNLSPGCFSPSISVPEDKVSCRSERDRGNGTEGVQLFFAIAVLSHVILAIFIPGGEEEKKPHL